MKLLSDVRRVKKKKKLRLPVIFCFICIVGILAVVFFLFNMRKNDQGKESDRAHLDTLYDTNDSKDDSSSMGKDSRIEKKGYAISTCNSYAADTGKSILEQGGNAIDAAIAMSYTLAVCEPYASGLGGGGCMVVYDPDEEHFYFYNYGSEAGKSGNSSWVLVPGFVSGMESLREDFGTMDYDKLMEDAIAYCDGVTVNEAMANRIDASSSYIGTDTRFYRDGHFLTEGDTLIQPELKETLQYLLEEGPEAFYKGKIAEDITSAFDITMEDMAAYETVKTDAVMGTFEEYTVAAAAAPYSGVTLIQMLEMAEHIDIASTEKNSADFLDDLYTITQAAHADRIKNVYDYKYYGEDVDQSEMVSADYIITLLNQNYDNFVDDEESEDTTSFTVIDKNGLIVSCTNTLSAFFGCKSDVDGFFMNNTGRNFGSGVNSYAPGKRPRSHISPVILISEDEKIAAATPGGNVIVKVLADILMDIGCFDTDPQEAVNKQRVIFGSGTMVNYEIGYDTPLFVEVSGSQYPAIAKQSHSWFGNVTLAGYNNDQGFFAVKDIRREGACVVSNP